MKITAYVKDRVIKEAHYIISTKKNMTEVAYEFRHSLSNLHKDFNVRLPHIDSKLYLQVREVIDEHILENQIRFIEMNKKSRI